MLARIAQYAGLRVFLVTHLFWQETVNIGNIHVKNTD